MIELPRFVSLDTSTIAKLARDFFSGEESKRGEVIKVRDSLVNSGWYLTVTSDHLIELAQHARAEIVISRYKFLQTFKNLAWIWNVEKTGIGSFLDIDCFEIRAVVDHEATSKTEVANEVRNQLIVTGTGNELFRDDDFALWLRAADESKQGLAKSQSTASILRTEPVPGVKKMKLREFLNSEYEDINGIPRKAGQLAAGMAKQIKNHGDKRVTDVENLARVFYQQTLQHIGDIQTAQKSNRNGSAFIEAVAEVFEIPRSAIDLDMTVGQLGDLGHFSLMLKIYSRKIQRTLSLDDVKPSELPGWSLRLKLRDFQNQANRVNGSDFGDRNLASLLPYLDSCEVDKRTWDYLRRFASKSDSDFSYLNHRFKCGDYRKILECLRD